MKNLLVNIFWILLLTAISCRNHTDPIIKEYLIHYTNTNINQEFHPAISHKLEPSIKVKLDDSLVVDKSTIVHFNVGNNELVILDNLYNRLLFYDLTSQTLIMKIKIKGLNGQKLGVTGLYVQDRNRIYLYDYTVKKIFLVDSTGQVKSVYKLNFPKIGEKNMYAGYPRPYVANGSPMIVQGDLIYFTGYLFGEIDKDDYLRRFTRIKYNMKTDQTSFDVLYSSVYHKGNWGGDYYRTPYFTVLPSGDQLISLPAEHNMIVIKPNDELQYKYASDRSQQITINSIALPKYKTLHLNNDTLTHQHFSTNYSYGNVISYPKKKLIIRILEHPLNKKDLNRYGGGIKPATILVFNSDFKLLDRFLLPKNLSSSNYFVNPNGIYFLNTLNKNENEAHYDLLSFP